MNLHLSSFVEEELQSYEKAQCYDEEEWMGQMGVSQEQIKRNKRCYKSSLEFVKNKIEEKEKNQI